MKMQTKFHGEIEMNEIIQWTFPKGLPGLEDETKFILLPIEGNDTFQMMQSISNPSIALVLSNPYALVSDYSFEVDDSTIELLSIQNPNDIMVLTVMTVKDPFELSTLNLQAPLIFNSTNHCAKQMILNDTKYQLRHSISQSIEKGAQ